MATSDVVDSSIPLVDVHRHLDGNIRPELIWSLANKYHLALPADSLDSLKSALIIQDQTPNLLSFLDKLNCGVSVLADAKACYDVAYDNVMSANKEGITVAELRFSPRFMSQTFCLSMHEVTEAVVSGVEDANRDHGSEHRLIGIMSRTFGTDACFEELAALLSYKQHLVAIDLAGDEKQFPGHLFVEHFRQVKESGLGVTVHAGEADGAQSVWDAIKLLGAQRIGHGVAIAEDESLMDYVGEHNIAIETCLTSNYQTATWLNYRSHPIRKFLNAGLNVSLNTDDPAISGITIHDEYQKARDLVGLSIQQTKQLQLNGVSQLFATKKPTE
ncbi:adenosine deaminase [Glaciecola sp. MH2013]|uniref:adenosine deaminase n=1 Tax=Glaciecola sp. MH2013 TaxID=2785524 RepID=UPI00189E8382|nr:adenosine deaminase [Glaciecola sp. MH2013]MBF7072887.1 adenosine deaminase [Glaciecola sp. MH2013]